MLVGDWWRWRSGPGPGPPSLPPWCGHNGGNLRFGCQSPPCRGKRKTKMPPASLSPDLLENLRGLPPWSGTNGLEIFSWDSFSGPFPILASLLCYSLHTSEVTLGQIKVSWPETSKVLWRLLQQGPYCPWRTPPLPKIPPFENHLFALSILNFCLKMNKKFIFSPWITKNKQLCKVEKSRPPPTSPRQSHKASTHSVLKGNHCNILENFFKVFRNKSLSCYYCFI